MKVYAFVASIVIVTGIIFVTFPQVRSTIKVPVYYPCDSPVPYKIGLIDSKFNMSQNTAKSSIQEATAIWKKSYGKPLFVETSNADLTVNFVYDQRSELNQQIDRQQNQLNQKDTDLQKRISAYEADVTAYKQRLTNLNSQIDQINRSGGASHDVYNNLIAQQRELNAQGDALNARAKQLNLATHDYNSSVRSLNQDVDQFNQAIAVKPEGGLYDGNKMTITIYFASNHQELIHTLAHEFGHVLRMQHTSDPKSIMYPNTTGFVNVTDQDKQQLTSACREESIFSHWMRVLRIKYTSLT